MNLDIYSKRINASSFSSILPIAGLAIGLYMGKNQNANYGKIFLLGCIGAYLGYLPKKIFIKKIVVFEKKHSEAQLIDEDYANELNKFTTSGKVYSTSLSQEEANNIAKKIVELENKKPVSNSDFKEIQSQMAELIKRLNYSKYGYKSGEAVKIN